MERGLPLVAAQGLAANIADESAFDSSIIGDAGMSAGLFQHYDTRRDALVAMAEAKGTTWDDPSLQMDMAAAELGFLRDPVAIELGIFGTERGAGEALANAASANQAADIALRQFERPKEPYRSERSARYLKMSDFPEPLGSLAPGEPIQDSRAIQPRDTDIAVASALWDGPPRPSGIMGSLGIFGTSTYQNLPPEQQYAAQAVGALVPGAGLVQSLGYAMNDREMQAAARMLEGTYEPRTGVFGIGADPQFVRAEPVYDERTGQLIGAMGYDAQGNPVMYRGQQQGIQYTGPGSEFLRGEGGEPRPFGLAGAGGEGGEPQPPAPAPPAPPTPVSQTSVECPPGFRFDPATNSCQPETPWPTYRPPAPVAQQPPGAYTQVPQFTLPPLLPYPSGGIASI